MIREKLTILIVVAAAFVCYLTPVGAVVDENQPDLNKFKLRHVDAADLSRKRAKEAIVDLGTGARYMHESVLVEDKYVKCPAYGHLFKMIKSQIENPTKLERIRQPAVESLSVKVVLDKVTYFDNFIVGIKDNTLADLFIEAVKLLENDHNRDNKYVWLDLIECVSVYMFGGRFANPQVKTFLNEPTRAKAISRLEEFKAIQVDGANQAPLGRVEELIQRYEHLDELIGNEKDELDEKAHSNPEPSPILSHQSKEAAIEKPIETKQDLSKIEVPDNIEVLLVDSKESSKGYKVEIDETQLAILKFIKLRYEMRPKNRYEKFPALNMRLAYDFNTHWNDLSASKLDKSTKLGKFGSAFLSDKNNQILAQRVRKVIADYAEMGTLIADLQEGGGNKSMEVFRSKFLKIKDLLENFDTSFDVEELRRLFSIWQVKYVEYDTMDRFVNDESWFG